MKLFHTRAGVLMIGVILGAAGCSSYSSYCSDAIDCVGGNDDDKDACVTTQQYHEDIASIYGCDDEWDNYITCTQDKSQCHDGQFDPEHDCDKENDALNKCIH